MTGTDDWRGRTVLIVGGSGGMGRAAAAEFRGAGADIVVADINEARPAAGCHWVRCDVTKVADCAGAVAEAVERTGRLDLLINAAGVWVEGPTESMTEADWDRTLDVNLKGTFLTCRHAIPELVKTEGHIINIASDAGLMGNAGAAIYCASKGGVVLLTKALALELAPRGVRVNAVCPCDVETPMLAFQASTYGGGDPEGYLRNLHKHYPQGARTRFARPEEIGAFLFMLASPRLKPITGAALSIDFGTTAGK